MDQGTVDIADLPDDVKHVEQFVRVPKSWQRTRMGSWAAGGNTSRTIDIVGERVIAKGKGFTADVVEPPQKVFGARAIIVVPKASQRKPLPVKKHLRG